ncbi:MAG TPA: PLDc N-terminal domain-containing protein [Solirubrobacteraceae bacterium]|jgi:hypothetical protein
MLLLTLIGIVLLLISILTIVDIVRRPDLGTGAKVLWSIAVIIFTLVGVIVYFIVRPAQPSDHAFAAETQEGEAPMEPMRHGPA